MKSIIVENISKTYKIKKTKSDETFREIISNPFKLFCRKNNTEEFHALKNISFDLEEGNVLGIIGKNGAGKSTLLKILSRITYPTSGKIKVNGKVASLLEVGTGFHQELTGRENIFVNGVILGMTNKKIRKVFDEIVDFSGVEKFLDTPLKRYSSGMQLRLAFAVAAKVNEGTITSSPLPMPAARRPRCKADVPELTATQCRPSTVAENSFSNAATSSPWVIIPDSRTRSTASRSIIPITGEEREITNCQLHRIQAQDRCRTPGTSDLF